MITVKEKKERAFHDGRLLCERCYERTAIWIEPHDDYKVYCEDCNQIIFWGKEDAIDHA